MKKVEKYRGNCQGTNGCTGDKEGELKYVFSEALQHSNDYLFIKTPLYLGLRKVIDQLLGSLCYMALEFHTVYILVHSCKIMNAFRRFNL